MMERLSQLKVKSQEFSELDIGGFESCFTLNFDCAEFCGTLLKSFYKPGGVNEVDYKRGIGENKDQTDLRGEI